MNTILIYFLLIFSVMLSSCESEQERNAKIQRDEQQRTELAKTQKEEELRSAMQQEQERIKLETQVEKERKEKEIYDKYINNSLHNGSAPYSYCYGSNENCSDNNCSQISVKTPHNSDVLVIIKENDVVVRHAYITEGSSYTFELPNGTYQPFFYYGKGWNPEKIMKEAPCGKLKGGFISDEVFGKDDPQRLNNNILQYELILQQNGNFSTRPSNLNDAL